MAVSPHLSSLIRSRIEWPLGTCRGLNRSRVPGMWLRGQLTAEGDYILQVLIQWLLYELSSKPMPQLCPGGLGTTLELM